MKILAVETSTVFGSVALVEHTEKTGSVVLIDESTLKQRSHSEFIHPAIDRCLKKVGWTIEEIDLYSVGIGPGSFTGIRVATNIVKSFAYSTNKRIAICDSLTLLAYNVLKNSDNKKIISMINAFKNMVFVNIFEKNIHEYQSIMNPIAIPIDRLQDFVTEPMICVGDGYETYCDQIESKTKDLLEVSDDIFNYPKACELGKISYDLSKKNKTIDWNLLLPLYIRASAAEENLTSKM